MNSPPDMNKELADPISNLRVANLVVALESVVLDTLTLCKSVYTATTVTAAATKTKNNA